MEISLLSSGLYRDSSRYYNLVMRAFNTIEEKKLFLFKKKQFKDIDEEIVRVTNVSQRSISHNLKPLKILKKVIHWFSLFFKFAISFGKKLIFYN